MTSTPARDFLLPRLTALLADAAAQGIAREVAVAVLIDLVTGPGFNDTPLDPRADDPPAQPETSPLTVDEVAVAEADATSPHPIEHVLNRLHRF